MSNNIDLSIIIVTYNSEKQITPLLHSIYRTKSSLSLEVIVVDNQSADGSFAIAKTHRLKPKMIQTGHNAGFPAAVNRGIKISSGTYVLLLNPDTVVMRDTLERLLEFAKDSHQLGAVAPRLLNPDGKPQASAFKFPSIMNAIRKYFGNCKNCFGKYIPDNRTQKIEVAVMAALLIPRTTIDLIGGLDEKYFMYYEDFEFCRQLARHKLPLYYLPSAKVRHIHGASGHFGSHQESPLLASARLYHGEFYSDILNLILWAGHKWQVLLRGKRFRD